MGKQRKISMSKNFTVGVPVFAQPPLPTPGLTPGSSGFFHFLRCQVISTGGKHICERWQVGKGKKVNMFRMEAIPGMDLRCAARFTRCSLLAQLALALPRC